MTSTRPRTVVVTCAMVCARNPAAPPPHRRSRSRSGLFDGSSLLAHFFAFSRSLLILSLRLSRLTLLAAASCAPIPESIPSKKNSHHQIEVPCVVPAVGKRIRRQVPILGGKQKVRPRTVNHVHKACQISRQRRIPVRHWIWEISQVAGKRIIHPKRGVELPFVRRPVFQLRPAANRVQRSHLRARRRRIAAEQHTLSECAIQSANRSSAIKLSAQRKLLVERQFDIRHCGPAIHVASEAIILPAVVAAHSDPKRLSENIPRPCRPVCRMPAGAMLPLAPAAGNNLCPIRLRAVPGASPLTGSRIPAWNIRLDSSPSVTLCSTRICGTQPHKFPA
jgi:hypothetical protein